MPQSKKNDFGFEIVDESELQFAKRGRKSNLDPSLIEAMKEVGKDQRIAFRSLKVEGEEIKTEKSRISSQIRAAAKAANWDGVSIKWTVDNTPTALRH